MNGATIERRYQLVGRLGRGAMGEVFEARSLAPALATHGVRRVALKALGPDHADNAAAVALFVHEAFLGSRLDHPNLLRVLDFGHLPDGRPYQVTLRTQGGTLEQLLRQGGPLPPPFALSLLGDAAAGLTHLHENGFVHRDVKPSNLLVATWGGRWPRLRVIDLGAAGIYDHVRAAGLGVAEGGARGTWGTPAYLAPEQALGARVDPRADVYALACVAYRALTGREPHRTRTIGDMVRAHLYEDPAPASTLNPALPTAFDAVLARGLAKDRRQRTPSVNALVDNLAAAIEQPREERLAS